MFITSRAFQLKGCPNSGFKGLRPALNAAELWLSNGSAVVKAGKENIRQGICSLWAAGNSRLYNGEAAGKPSA